MPFYNCPSNRSYRLNEKDYLHNQALWQALSLIEDDASLYLPRYLLGYKFQRKMLREVCPGCDMPQGSRFYKYILVDSWTKDPYTVKGYEKWFIKNLNNNPDYCLIYDKAGVRLYKLKTKDGK